MSHPFIVDFNDVSGQLAEKLPEAIPSAVTPESGVARETLLAQVERILRSGTFARSRRLGRFLRFIVEQSLSGNAGILKEYLLGVEIFDKGETFDPRLDSIVRVEARRLRSKLKVYYNNEGCDDHILIELPKGSYVPAILNRSEVSTSGLRNWMDATQTIIAVAPLRNISEHPIGGNFCLGLREDVIAVVSKTEGFQAAATFRFTPTLREEEGTLHLNLEGAIRMDENRVRVSMKAVDPVLGVYIWCHSYDRKLGEFLEVQADLAGQIADDLRTALKSCKVPVVGKH